MAVPVWFLVASLILLSDVAAGADNPADELVNVLNDNRTAHKSSSLVDNPGLGCIALQYIKAYQGQCDEVVKGKKPADSEFAETFSTNCGVQASTLGPITGRLLGCETRYVDPSAAFSGILIKNSKSLDILYNKNHTQVGAAVSGSDGGSPYFWCLLFAGGQPNRTFVPDGGQAKVQRPGCFSGANDDCNGGDGSQSRLLWPSLIGSFIITLAYALGL